MRRVFSVVLVTLLIQFASACNFVFEPAKNSKEYFLLTDNNNESDVAGEEGEKNKRLLVRDPSSSRFINSQRIIYGESSTTRGYYQFAFWVDPPPKLFSELLLKRLQKSNLFLSVASQSSVTKADLQLNIDFHKFYHDIESRPGRAVVELTAELIDFRERIIIASKTFKSAAKVDSYDAQGAAEAFSDSVTEVIDQINGWLSVVQQG